MKCNKCGGETAKKSGAVYGQPSQSTKYEECKKCGLEQNQKVEGIRVFDEHDKDSKVVSGS